MQVHDSLIVETPEKDAEKVGETMKDIMENIYPELPVKLKADISTGHNWGQL
jgi:DNA polymerase I-like protein with 3'-5' exonuclease and polymerase domains